MARVIHLLSDCQNGLSNKQLKMTDSSIIQTIAVLGIVAVALVYVLRRVIKTTRGRGDCGCGCGKDCKCKNKHFD